MSATGFAAAGYLVLTWPLPEILTAQAAIHPVPVALTPLAVLTAWYLTWQARHVSRPRRPVLLIVDDLDRCDATRVVKLLETVHTLLRQPAEPRTFRRWRTPAPLIVLALADGRWIRTAFEKHYADYDTLGSDVHSLGAEFLQKIFDHVVLVPALTASQTLTFTAHITHTAPRALLDLARDKSTAPTTTPVPPGQPPSPAPADPETTARPARPSELNETAAQPRTTQPSLERVSINSGPPHRAPMAIFNLGAVAERAGRVEEARTWYQQAIESGHPDVAPKAMVNLGNLAAEAGHLEEARTWYQQAIESGHPDQAPAAMRALGRLAGEAGHLDEASTWYQQQSATASAARAIESIAAEEVQSSAEIRDAIARAPREDQPELKEKVAAKAGSPEALAAFRRHLLTTFTDVMPANPRLVIRVANAFGMLMAIQLQLDRRDPKDLVAAAAIILVRYPNLVDQLLSDPDPPTIDPQHPTAQNAKTNPWLRRDVQHVMRYSPGGPLDVRQLAACYGRLYGPDLPTATPAPSTTAPPVPPQ